MSFATNARPISYLRHHAADVVKCVATGDPMFITQNGKARLVIMDADAYEQREQSMVLLKILAIGNRDIERGRVQDAEAVFAELDAMDKTDNIECCCLRFYAIDTANRPAT